MRLIDADAMKSWIDCGHLRSPMEVCLSELDVVQMLDKQPTIDAEPVRHGRWIQSKTVPSYHSCSYCKRAHNMPKSCGVYVLPFYCPNCGAKMDLDEQETEG